MSILTHDYTLVHPSRKNVFTNVSVAEVILQNIHEFGNTVAVVSSLTDEKISYSDISQHSLAVAISLKTRGIKPGDVIAICSENRIEYVIAMLGILAVGATCAPLNPVYTPSELQHTLSISRPCLIFCSPFAIKKISEVKSTMPFIQELILFDKINTGHEFSSFQSLLKINKNEKFVMEATDSQNAVAFLFCSSGTTGLPKCVELTHANILHLLNFIRLLSSKDDNNFKKVTLGLIPFFHGYGCCILLNSLMLGILTVVMPRFEEKNFLSAIEKYKITNLYVVPSIIVFLSKSPIVSNYDLSSLKKLVCGAAFLSKEIQATAQRRLNLNFDIQQGYGMTELSICCVAFQNQCKKIGSSGTIAPGMELKVVDIKTGKSLPPFHQGELCFRGPFVMKGYKNNPEETAASFDPENWFHTGDIGYYDKDGYIYIAGRLKELIKYKGFQVAPAELETILLDHPSIKDAGVVGIPDEEAGELPFAFVVKQSGAIITEEEIIKYVADKVSPQKRLHGGIRFINEIPKNSNGKILRQELQKLVRKSKL